MKASDLLDIFIENKQPPDILSREYMEKDGEEVVVIRFEWLSEMILNLSYDHTDYNESWVKFQKYWTKGKYKTGPLQLQGYGIQ